MTKTTITGIYLAAGKSSRFGSSKLHPKIGKHPLGSNALMTALRSKLDQIAVVTKKSDTLDWIPPHLYNEKWAHIPCNKSVHGQAYSIRCGLNFAQSSNAEAVIIMLADQPLISKEMINKLIDRYEQMKKKRESVSFIASTRAGLPCPPILFSKKMFRELSQLQGDTGARFLIQEKMEVGSFIPFTNSQLFLDVDTTEDYMKLKRQSNQP